MSEMPRAIKLKFGMYTTKDGRHFRSKTHLNIMELHMTFLFFLSITHWCDAPASLHTTMCLDINMYYSSLHCTQFQMYHTQLISLYIYNYVFTIETCVMYSIQ